MFANSSVATTLDTSAITANQTITIPDKSGTMMVRTFGILKMTLTSNGTGNPGLVVLENTFGGTPTITRIATGRYTITLSGAFPTNDTKLQFTVSYGLNSTDDNSQCRSFGNGDDLKIRTFAVWDSSNYYDIDANTRITIEVYP